MEGRLAHIAPIQLEQAASDQMIRSKLASVRVSAQEKIGSGVGRCTESVRLMIHQDDGAEGSA